MVKICHLKSTYPFIHECLVKEDGFPLMMQYSIQYKLLKDWNFKILDKISL